jgi:hypothetical protein
MTVKIDGSNGLLQNYDYETPTTGFTYTFIGYNVLFMVPAGTLATGTVTMPASPVDGMTVTIASTQQITALTINANTGQSIIGGGAVQLNANTSRQYLYSLANTTWYLLNIAAGNVVTSVNGVTGAVTLATGIQTFTTSGTFTIPANVTSVKVTVVGGGGAGGSSSENGAGYSNGAAGGGGGGAAINYLTSLTPGNTLTVTVGGAGGTSSVASGTQTISTVSATGGATGGASSNGSGGVGGAGGVGSGGSINLRGSSGGTVGGVGFSGGGGSSIFGGGAAGVLAGSAGTAGQVYGGGGSGGCLTQGVNSSVAGGAGSAGVVVFEW